VQKNKWAPTASLATLRARSAFLQSIRLFFESQAVIEVDVPLLSKGVATDLGLAAFSVGEHYLQTSPEFPMKRLLAAFKTHIYYLGKAFRKEESGARHNPEFTMLEWYRVGWDHHQLIAEVDHLFQTLLGCPAAEHTTYQALFETYLGIHPHKMTCIELQAVAMKEGWIANALELDKDGWLDLLLTHGIEPHLGKSAPLVIVDYPASQASLAKTRETEEGFMVAERFEFYYQGMELANGYHELTCPHEQQRRFEKDSADRKRRGLEERSLDHALLAALAHGLPPCAGVAVGVDRLLMLKLKQNHIADVLPFTSDRA